MLPTAKTAACRRSTQCCGTEAAMHQAVLGLVVVLCTAVVILDNAAPRAQVGLPFGSSRRELRDDPHTRRFQLQSGGPNSTAPSLTREGGSQGPGTVAAQAAQGAPFAHPAAAVQPVTAPTPRMDKYHVIIASGEGIYEEWQTRVVHYWYKKTKEVCEVELGERCAMGGYTRLLHSGQPDDWMDEMHTVVVEPMPRGLEQLGEDYAPVMRPYAYMQWVEKYLDSIPESYIWMGDPDHLFLRAPPLWATPESPAGFPFGYMTYEDKKDAIDPYNPKGVPLNQFADIGPAPLQIHKQQFATIVDRWFNLTVRFLQDPVVAKYIDWEKEMFSYTTAAATTLAKPIRHTLHPEIQMHTPFDEGFLAENGVFFDMIHFTHQVACDAQGKCYNPAVAAPPGQWRWHKRDYMYDYIPRDYPMPPPCSPPVIKELVRRVNEAADNLPGWAEREGTVPEFYKTQQ